MRFIDQFLKAVHSAIMLRGFSNDPSYRRYRDATAPKFHRPGGGAWRSVNPDASTPTVAKRRAAEHKKWTKATRQERHQQAERNALLHALGRTPKAPLSARGQRRITQLARQRFDKKSARYLLGA